MRFDVGLSRGRGGETSRRGRGERRQLGEGIRKEEVGEKGIEKEKRERGGDAVEG